MKLRSSLLAFSRVVGWHTLLGSSIIAASLQILPPFPFPAAQADDEQLESSEPTGSTLRIIERSLTEIPSETATDRNAPSEPAVREPATSDLTPANHDSRPATPPNGLHQGARRETKPSIATALNEQRTSATRVIPPTLPQLNSPSQPTATASQAFSALPRPGSASILVEDRPRSIVAAAPQAANKPSKPMATPRVATSVPAHPPATRVAAPRSAQQPAVAARTAARTANAKPPELLKLPDTVVNLFRQILPHDPDTTSEQNNKPSAQTRPSTTDVVKSPMPASAPRVTPAARTAVVSVNISDSRPVASAQPAVDRVAQTQATVLANRSTSSTVAASSAAIAPHPPVAPATAQIAAEPFSRHLSSRRTVNTPPARSQLAD